MTAVGDFYAPQYSVERRLYVGHCNDFFIEVGASSAISYVCICTVLNNGTCLRTDSLQRKSVGLSNELTSINSNQPALHLQGAKGLEFFEMLELHENRVKANLFSGTLEVAVNSDNVNMLNHYAEQLTARGTRSNSGKQA